MPGWSTRSLVDPVADWCGAPGLGAVVGRERLEGGGREVNPLAPGWQDRLWLLNIREVLSMVAHVGDSRGSLVPLRAIRARFA